jgi:hypothetical protein
VVYAVPEPDAELRALMRALLARYPDTPPTARRATIRRRTPRSRGSTYRRPRTLEGVRERVAGLLPARFVTSEVTLMEEIEPNVWRVRKQLPLGNQEP